MKNAKIIIRNILIAPMVIAVNAPIMLNYWLCEKFISIVDNSEHILPKFKHLK